jgi:hypothetical protein
MASLEPEWSMRFCDMASPAFAALFGRQVGWMVCTRFVIDTQRQIPSSCFKAIFSLRRIVSEP